MLNIKVGFDWPRGSEKKFLNIMVIYIYVYCPGIGADESIWSYFFQNHLF